MFSATVVAKTWGSSSTSPTVRRTSSRASRGRSTPPRRDRPRLGIHEAQQQRGERALARAGGADDADPATAGHREGQVGEGRVVVPAGRHAGDLDLRVVGRGHRGPGRHDRGRQREQRVEAVLRSLRPGRGGAGVDDGDDDLGERQRQQHEQSGDRRRQVARRDLRADDEGHGGDGSAAADEREQRGPGRASGRCARCPARPRRWPRRRRRWRVRRPATSPARRRPGWSRRRVRTGGHGPRCCPAGCEPRRPGRRRGRAPPTTQAPATTRPVGGSSRAEVPAASTATRTSPRTGIRLRSSRSSTLSTSSTTEARTSPRRGPRRPGVSGTSASYTSARRRASMPRAESWDSTRSA